jgi:hypothetical protein
MSHTTQCRKQPKTQGQKIVERLQKRWMSYSDMLALGVSLCPWKRVKDAIPEGHIVDKRTNAKGLIEWRVVRKKSQGVAA